MTCIRLRPNPMKQGAVKQGEYELAGSVPAEGVRTEQGSRSLLRSPNTRPTCPHGVGFMRTPLALLVSLASVSVSCSSDAFAPLDAAVVQATVAPATVFSGDTVRVVVSLANPTARPMRFQPARTVCYLEFEVRDSAGVWVGPNDWGCIAIVPQPVELGPHSTRRVDFLWRVRACNPTGTCVDAAPGRYTLHGLADVGGPVALQSPAVLLQVLPQ